MVLESWAFGMLGSWNHRVLGPWDPRILKTWDQEILGPRDFGILGYRRLMDPEIYIIWITSRGSGALESWGGIGDFFGGLEYYTKRARVKNDF